MKIYIFDLDDTLLYKPYKSYKDIRLDYKLQQLLKDCKYPKYIFSNATTGHVDESLKQIGIYHHFTSKFTRDNVPLMKPYPAGYRYVNTNVLFQNVNLDYYYNDDVDIYFFDDLLENLITAKKFGWTTIWIQDTEEYYPFVDYQFKTIIDALTFFKKLETGQSYNQLL